MLDRHVHQLVGAAPAISTRLLRRLSRRASSVSVSRNGGCGSIPPLEGGIEHAAVRPLFTCVGRFVLEQQFWVNRYRSGVLVTKSLEWHDVTVRDYGSTAVSVGIQTQQATHRGEPKDGNFRGTHIAVDTPDGWRLAGIHLSPIM